jgi:RsiW-degrading membrane proteinase PrsW (M82 family)
MIAGLLALVPVYIKRAVFHQEPAAELASSCVLTMLWLSMNLMIIHLVISKVGMIYTDAEVLREGNDQTLNNLEEGVIILDEKDLQI